MENLDSKMLEAALNGNLTTVEELVLKDKKTRLAKKHRQRHQ